MIFIKYFNLFCSIFRFVLMLYILSSSIFLAFPIPLEYNPFLYIMIFYTSLNLPIFTIINLITITFGVINRNLNLKNEENNCINYFFGFFCCCACTRNVSYLQLYSLIHNIIIFIWSLIILFYFIIDINTRNENIFCPYLNENVVKKIILYIIDSILLLCHFYCFDYYDYFLKRAEIYIEFYKRLIIKNKNKEAEIVRKELPDNLDNYLKDSATEMNNV